MSVTLSPDQEKARDQITDWYTSLKVSLHHCNGGSSRLRGFGDCPSMPHTHGMGRAPVYSLGGLAGTGKTTLMKALAEELGARVVFGAPTHKAAAVLRKKLDQDARVRTYHSLIYHMSPTYHCGITGKQVWRIVDHCTCKQPDACECPARFDPCDSKSQHVCEIREELTSRRREYLAGHLEILIIDEASMLSTESVEDLLSFGVPVLLVGDPGQLPPVNADMNPWTEDPSVLLTEIHRQGAHSGILVAAHDVRRNGRLTQPYYGTGDAYCMPFTDPEMDGVLQRFTPGPEKVIITPTNRLRADFNAFFHGEGPPRAGDRVVCLDSHTHDTVRVVMEGGSFRATKDFLMTYNGMTGTVLKVTDRGGPLIDMVVQLDDHILATPHEPVCLLIAGAARTQFGADRNLLKNSPDRPKHARLWDYAYVLTAHKAQGSEFNQVIVIDSRPPSYTQWLYTAITRAKEAVIIADYLK